VREAAFTDLLSNGQGVGRIDDLVVFAWGPLPGERARVRIELIKAKYAVGELVELLTESPERAVPFCKLFGTCGGCQVQHLSYDAQLEWKRRLVSSALERIGAIHGVEVAPAIGMDRPRGYRNKVALVARGQELGFYAARSHDFVPVHSCPVAMPQLDGLIGRLWGAASDPETRAAFDGALHVIARAGLASGEAVVSFTTERRSESLQSVAPGLAAKLPGTVGIANSFSPASANAVVGRRHMTGWGRVDMEERIEGLRFRVSPASFFQVNSETVGRIFEFMAPRLAALERVVDLYCGAGTFALYFAKHGATVTGIEENPSAIAEARVNAKINALEERTTFVAGRVERVLAEPSQAATLRSAQLVFLDPPRKGSEEPTLAAIVRSRVPNVWYLSCNPATLARDLAQLHAGGYRPSLVQPFDMFPQTGHVEALALLEFAGG